MLYIKLITKILICPGENICVKIIVLFFIFLTQKIADSKKYPDISYL
jgi:hypothetical protein